jgi:hypothetical protein
LNGLDQVGPRQVAEKIEQGRRESGIGGRQGGAVHHHAEVSLGDSGFLDLAGETMPQNVANQDRIGFETERERRLVWAGPLVESQQVDANLVAQSTQLTKVNPDPPASPAGEKFIGRCH